MRHSPWGGQKAAFFTDLPKVSAVLAALTQPKSQLLRNSWLFLVGMNYDQL